jgi:hypothetical protein
MNLRDRCTQVVRILLALVLAYAAISKAFEPASLYAPMNAALGASFDEKSLFAGVTALVILELAVAAMLFAWSRPRTASLLAVGLLVFLTIMTLRLAIDPTAPPCGCFGAGAKRVLPADAQASNRLALARNALLLGAAGWLGWGSLRRRQATRLAVLNQPS